MISAENSRVTAIIPTFRSEKFILRALESILAQTHQVDEIIVVDDASDDSTVATVQQFASQHKHIRIITNAKNQGPGRSRNTAWSAATTEYIAFLDADDSWHPNKIATQLDWFKNNPNAVICGTQHRIVNEPDQSEPVEKVSTFKLKDLLKRNRFSTPSAMLRNDITVRFDSNARFSEDYLLWMEIAATYGSVCRINQQLTILHKPTFGVNGLSGRLFSMYAGELNAIRTLHRKKHITSLTKSTIYVWSTIKFIRRIPMSLLRRLAWG